MIRDHETLESLVLDVKRVMPRNQEDTNSEDEHEGPSSYVETTLCGGIRPQRDSAKNFIVDLDALIRYVRILKRTDPNQINYIRAALILQSSREVNSRKVDYLETLFYAFVKTIRCHQRKTENAVPQKTSNRRPKQDWPAPNEFAIVSKDEIALLSEREILLLFLI